MWNRPDLGCTHAIVLAILAFHHGHGVGPPHAHSGFSSGAGGGSAYSTPASFAYPFRSSWPYSGSFGGYGSPVIFSPPIFPVAPYPYPYPLPPAAVGPAIPPPTALDQGIGVPWRARRPLSDEFRKAKRADPTRARQLTTYGDRLFRSGNTLRSGERYAQALKADPNQAAPHVGLAQIAIVRGQYEEAAGQLRKALEADPNWLVHAPDVQALYGEPADFAKAIAKVESHLQANGNDRDAWFVLGAQWYLSGRTQKAADVLLRISDRSGDPILAAFLDAATPIK